MIPESSQFGLTLLGGLTDKFPASAFFETMNGALQSSEADKKQAMDMGKGIYAFTLKNAAGETDSWHIDLKNEGKVGKGVGEKPDGMFMIPFAILSSHLTMLGTTVTLSLSEADFQSLVTGKGNAQRLFMSGKLKIKGNVMKATKLDPILKQAQTKAKL